MAIKVLFCGTPDFARQELEDLLKDSDYDIVTVVSQPDRPSGRGHKMQPSPVKELAHQYNIPVLTPEKASDPQFIEEISKTAYDVCIVVAYGQILRRSFLELFPKKCVNLHASLLPRWRGAAPIQRALMAGDAKTGMCLQVVVPKLDAGAVIGERELSLTIDDDAKGVHDRLAQLGSELLATDLKKYLRGELTPREQDESLVTYAHKIDKSEAEIRWEDSAFDIHNKVRGLALGPQASCSFQGKRLKIIKTKIIKSAGVPGVVIEAAGDRLVVGCGVDALELVTVQPESKKPMAAGEFLRGYKMKSGDLLAAP